jgi:hypothetical protein
MEWRSNDVKPPEPGVYPVRVPMMDATGEMSYVAERYAKWTGTWWCGWAVDPNRAAMCDLPLGPVQGYRWRAITAESIG